MVSFISKGRMGNFLWVACAAYAYALKHDLEFHAQDKSIAPHMWPLYLHHLQNKKWDKSLLEVEVDDGDHRFSELHFKEEWRDKNIIIGNKGINTGYFQSYKYFEGYESQICEAFNLAPYIQGGICSIHFRAGDYLQFPTKHPVIALEYLMSAIRLMIDERGIGQFVLYTDDYATASPIFNEISKRINAIYQNNIRFFLSVQSNELYDFRNMMCSENNIVANSSYSVLAAILNPNTNKLVICPHEDNYFGIDNKHLSVQDLYPPDWIRIKY